MINDNHQIDKEELGNYLGGGRAMNALVRESFLDLIDFSHLEFDMALRRFLHWFRLPGEAQKIDRLMESFSKKYFAQQSTCYDTPLFADEGNIVIIGIVVNGIVINSKQIRCCLYLSIFNNHVKYRYA
jgi:hypothetical protein